MKTWLGKFPTGKLDVLINNAAQTLTDNVKKEGQMVALEATKALLLTNTPSEAPAGKSLVAQGSGGYIYTPRVRGGSNPVVTRTQHLLTSTTPSPQNHHDGPKSSWTQSLHEIPYEDVISAHSINVFVPLILFRELLPSLSLPRVHPTSPKKSGTYPTAYVINVTSREAFQENMPSHRSKAGITYTRI